MEKNKTQLSRRDLLRGTAQMGLGSMLVPLTGFSPSRQNNESHATTGDLRPSELFAAAVVYTPSVIYATEGVETNIYFDNVIFSNLPNAMLSVDIVCKKGRQYEKFWRITPTAEDTGETTFTLEVRFDGKLLASKTSQLIVSDKETAKGKSIKVLCIGDSTTAGGQYVKIINTDYQSLASPAMTFLGTRGSAPDRHEGRGGWKFSQYAGDGGKTAKSPNPFWNLETKQLDFRNYLADNGYTLSSDDLITVHLGINDVFNGVSEDKLASIKADFDKLVSLFRAVVPGITIGLCLTIPPSISQDAFAISYSTGQTLNGYMENYKQLVAFLLAHYDTPQMRASKLYCIGFNHCIDRTHNFNRSTMPANARNPTPIDTWKNGVHPDASGYYQMGDALYAFIRYSAMSSQ